MTNCKRYKVAAIDLGTVSSRLALAQVEGGAIVESSKHTEITDLGEGVDNAWFLLRLSLHDPVLPLNAESDVPGGIKVMLKQLYDVIKDCEDVDLTPLKNAIED